MKTKDLRSTEFALLKRLQRQIDKEKSQPQPLVKDTFGFLTPSLSLSISPKNTRLGLYERRSKKGR